MEVMGKQEFADGAAQKIGTIAKIDETETASEPGQKKYPAGKREFRFGLGIIISGLLMANATIYGGFNLGFAVAAILSIVISAVYLQTVNREQKATPNKTYALILLALSTVIAASFVRADDGYVKFVMLMFLMVSVNLGLCLLAGKNRRSPDTLASLGDAGHTLFSLGFGEMEPVSRGVKEGFRHSGPAGKKGGAVLLGLSMAVPVLLVICFLLMRADAAFEGLMDRLPDFSLGEFIGTILVGGCIAIVLYTRGAALKHSEGRPVVTRTRKGLAALTVNTVLVSVSLVYVVYLVSQLAYFIGGFAGILPEEYTLAEYARRGFFEMAVLCGINLSIMVFSLWVCREKEPTPLSTRILCLVIGIVTLFFVAAASAKMILYIDSYGLTRLRLLTQIVMIFLGITTAVVNVWLFVPRLPYMKVVLVIALIMGAAVSWADVDTQVARYNVNAYLEGRIYGVDVGHLMNMGDGAIPYLAKLQEEVTDAQVLEDVKIALEYRLSHVEAEDDDFRDWNYAEWRAAKYLGDKAERLEEAAE